MAVRNPLPTNGCDAAVGLSDAAGLVLGVTIAVVAPHALTSRVATHAPAARACVQGEGKVTPPRIAERSRLSRRRCEDNRPHGNALCTPRHPLGTRTCRATRRAHRS